jgi:predicted RNase H-like nuclease (RuvC/YqgF family)
MDNRLDVSSLYRMGQRGGSKTSSNVSPKKNYPKNNNKYGKEVYAIKDKNDGLDGLRMRNRFLQSENEKLKQENEKLKKQLKQ